ncbi:RNA polymerase sigma-70 factor [Pedobacter yulinensis]|uniref:RNA polymerase sigma-70 factor n=1 Tax=Pedobacter yulinensis TaxID=2126353 RepID=A0A2T3HQ28_9SPHI|nr:RNA polymerase sigma-70 factor [Pedobacter yulinensis]PST84493.1 RNA polymerase sigma-70 factor [Pedobacter yulinensis]
MRTDHELWENIGEGDERAFAELFNRYSSRTYSYAFYQLKDAVVCEQIVHDVFLTLWNNRSRLEVRSFSAYLKSAALYRVYKHIKASKVIPIDYQEDVTAHHVTAAFSVRSEAVDQFEYDDIRHRLNTYLDFLPKRCREIFVLSREKSMSNEEIADQLGISKRTVENQLTYALRHLRSSFKEVSVLFVILKTLSGS